MSESVTECCIILYAYPRFCDLHPPYLPIDYPSIPQALPKVPHPVGDAIGEAEFEKVENAEVGENLKHFASHENQAECPKTQRSPARSNRTGLLDTAKAALSGGPQIQSGVTLLLHS